MAKKSEAKVTFVAETGKFNDAIKKASGEMSELRAELKLNEEEMKTTGTTTEGLEKKHKLLTEQLDASKKKTEALNEKLNKAIEIFGENSDEASKLRTQLMNAKTAEEKIKQAINSCNKELDDQEEELEDVKDATEEASDGFTVMKGAMADLVADGISAVIGGFKDAISGLMGLSEETQEYREALNKLNTAFLNSGHTVEQATAVYKELYSVFGEEDRAVEASQQIANIARSQEDMIRMTNIATGAWAKWGDSLATESLMEAISHTSKLGEVQGTLSDALEWCGISVEDFNKKLSKKNTEEERTEFILTELESLYSNSADLYRKNNKSIMEARRATSDYNDVLAEMGAEMEPVNTELKKMKTEFLEELTPTIKRKVVPAFEDFVDEMSKSGALEDFSDLIGDLAETLLPILCDGLKFVIKNFKGIAIAVGTAVVAFKTMSIISTVTTAIKGATSAMGAFNAIIAANPIGALVTVIGVATVGIMAMTNSAGNAIDAMELMSDEELDLIERTDAMTESIQSTTESVDKMSGALTAEMEHTTKLADELMGLTDEKGRVQEADRVRAQFILNELNDALGKEYKMVDGTIQQYSTLKESIYEVIDAKAANALLEAHEEEYVEAIQNESAALQQVTEWYTKKQERIASTQSAESEYKAAYEQYEKDLAACKTDADKMALASDAWRVAELARNWEEEKACLAQATQKYDESLANYNEYHSNIVDYENASMLIQQGNYEQAVGILQNKGQAYFEYADDVSEATKSAVDALYEEAIQAGIKAEETKKNFEAGVEGYTEEMVKEAEDGYNAALEKWATAYEDANGVGKDLGSGLAEGMESERGSLITKAKSIVDDIISGMRTAADSHSPSRKTIAFGQDLGAGTEIGLESKTKGILKTARDQVDGVLGAYNSELGSVNFGATFGSLPAINRNTSATIEHRINGGGFGALASAITELLNRPIVLDINGQRFATATAGDSDNVNGLRMTLKDRGLVLD